MKKLAFAAAALAFTGSAYAADMPLKAAAPMLAPFGWTGWYIGGNIGYGWGTANNDVIPLPNATQFVNLLPQQLKASPKGVLGGGQIGYNAQLGNLVLGVEADIQGSDIKGGVIESPIIQNNGTPFPGAGNNITINSNIDWFGTVRGRFGTTILDPRVLLFATGGLAFGQVSTNANTNFLPVGTIQYPASFSNTQVGWAVGAGIEWAFAQNWSAKVEYLHVDLGTVGVTANPVPANPPFQVSYNTHSYVDLARIGINYKF